MTFKSIMQDDINDIILNLDEFAEPITYTPDGGSPIVIDALIDRRRLMPGQFSESTLSRDCEIYISNETLEGVESINKGNDQVSFPEFIGGSNVTWRVVDIIEHDETMWRLQVRK